MSSAVCSIFFRYGRICGRAGAGESGIRDETGAGGSRDGMRLSLAVFRGGFAEQIRRLDDCRRQSWFCAGGSGEGFEPADFCPLIADAGGGNRMGFLTGWMEKHVVGAIGPQFDFLTPLDRCCIAGRAILVLSGEIALASKVDVHLSTLEVDPRQRAVVIAVSAVGMRLTDRLLAAAAADRPRAPIAAMLFFAGTLVPALGFVNVFPMQFSYVADHFQYLACIGPIVLLVVGAKRSGHFAKPADDTSGAIVPRHREPVHCEQSARSRVSRSPLLWDGHAGEKSDVANGAQQLRRWQLMHAGELTRPVRSSAKRCSLRSRCGGLGRVGRMFRDRGRLSRRRGTCIRRPSTQRRFQPSR